jgi:hypothetical protein
MEFDPNSEFVPSSKIDHVGINAPTEEFESLIEFYKKALAPLKYKELMRVPGAVGLGDQVPDFWISETKDQTKQNVHFAFTSNGTEASRVRLRGGVANECRPQDGGCVPRGCHCRRRKRQWEARPTNRISSELLCFLYRGPSGK